MSQIWPQTGLKTFSKINKYNNLHFPLSTSNFTKALHSFPFLFFVTAPPDSDSSLARQSTSPIPGVEKMRQHPSPDATQGQVYSPSLLSRLYRFKLFNNFCRGICPMCNVKCHLSNVLIVVYSGLAEKSRKSGTEKSLTFSSPLKGNN